MNFVAHPIFECLLCTRHGVLETLWRAEINQVEGVSCKVPVAERKGVGLSEEQRGWPCGWSRESASCLRCEEAGDMGKGQTSPRLAGRAIAAEGMAGSCCPCTVSKRVAFHQQTVVKTSIKRQH